MNILIIILTSLSLLIFNCGGRSVVKPDSTEKTTTEISSTDTIQPKVIISFIDVGQGDAILIQTPKKNILIDAGDRDGGVVVLDSIRSKKIDTLHKVIATHPHADHIGGLVNIIREIPIKKIIDPGVSHTSRTYQLYSNAISQNDIERIKGRTGMEFELCENSRIEILHPLEPSEEDLNNASIVARLIHINNSYLFTGDAESEAEEEILQRHSDIQSDVLKVGHHGSRTSITLEFLEAINPQYAIIMCGADNRFGHPTEIVLNRLEDNNVTIYRTDLDGTITIICDGEDIHVN